MRRINYALFVLELLVGLNAVWGGYGLIFKNGLKMPLAWLAGSPFHSYLGPGLILALVVGGANLVAAYAAIRKKTWTAEASATAGFSLLIWLFSEIYIIHQSSWLHIIFYLIGILILVLTMFLVKVRSRLPLNP